VQHAQAFTPERLREFFQPRAIALVGATDKSRWSLNTFQNLKSFGFPGPIYCVNPHQEIVHGERAFQRLSDLPVAIDLAFIMVPTGLVYSILQEAAAVGIRNVVILTSGFGELGGQGQEMEQELLSFAQQHDMVMLGPNGNGFVNVAQQLIPYGLPIQPPLVKGPIGIVLQSGALASAVITLAQARHIGLSLLVSMGNETMITATDVMNYLIEDDETRVIAIFLETIRDPALFERVAQRALERNKPIVAFKVGKSEMSARAAKAHTGAMVGNDAINAAMFKQLGIIRVHSLEDLLITAEVLGYSKPLRGPRMGLVTPSGGACDILADRASEEGIQLPDFTPETVRGLQQILPAFSTAHNPLDVTGYIVIDRTLQQQALQVVVDDPGLDFIVYLSEPPRIEPPPTQLAPFVEQYKALGTIIRQSPLPIIILSNTCTDLAPFGRSIADAAGIHFVGGMEHGMTALGHAIWWYQAAQSAQAANNAQKLFQTTAHGQETQSTVPPIDLPISPVGNWSEYTARTFLQAQGISVVPGSLTSSAEDALQAARGFSFPVAMKIVASDILHKSDVGGVMLNVNSEEGVRQSFAAIMDNVKEQAHSQTIEGILVSPMRPAGRELLVGILSDASWGQTLVLGLGGIWTEIFNDTSVRVLPVQRDEIKDMLAELRGAALLQGLRGQPAYDIEQAVEVIYRISQVAQSLRAHLDTLEINPLLLSGTSVEVLDVLLTWKK